MVIMRMGARYGGLNPVIAADLWKRIGIPKMLYGCEEGGKGFFREP